MQRWILCMAVGLAACQDYELNREWTDGESAKLQVDPPLLDFGRLAPGVRLEQSFLVTNVGSASAHLDEVYLAQSTPFEVLTSLGDVVLAPDENIEVAVAYSALSIDDIAVAVVQSDALDPDLPVQLRGAAALPRLSVTPPTLEFVTPTGERLVESVTVANVGTAPLTVEQLLPVPERFTVEEPVPFELAPGETREVEVTFLPDEPGEVDGTLWVGSDAGEAIVDLRGDWFVCVGLAEAWDRDWLVVEYLSTGGHRITNFGDEAVCQDAWYVFLSDISQDATLGDPALLDDGAVVEIPPGESVDFGYAPDYESEPPEWYCVEQTQVVTPTTSFTFNGARLPSPLLEMTIDSDWAGQYDIWDYIDENPVMLSGRVDNSFQMEEGDTVEVEVEVLNLGRQAAAATIEETIPDGLQAWNFSVPPDMELSNNDGSTTYVWSVVLEGAIDTDQSLPTIYDRAFVRYALGLELCSSARLEVPAPVSEWTDSSGGSHVSSGSPLWVSCTP